jgi:hypothetical protein
MSKDWLQEVNDIIVSTVVNLNYQNIIVLDELFYLCPTSSPTKLALANAIIEDKEMPFWVMCNYFRASTWGVQKVPDKTPTTEEIEYDTKLIFRNEIKSKIDQYLKNPKSNLRTLKEIVDYIPLRLSYLKDQVDVAINKQKTINNISRILEKGGELRIKNEEWRMKN